jgi:uncharacterized protein (UPF0335 family)
MPMLIARDDVAARTERAKAVQILAKSIFKELRTQGYDTKEIVALSTELLGLVTNELRPAK